MEAYIILGFLFGYPLVVGTLFRVSTSLLFATILAAELLERYFVYDVQLVLQSFVGSEVVLSYVGIIMLSLPVLLTGIFLKGSLSRMKVALHFIPLILCGIVFAAFAAPVLPEIIQSELATIEIGSLLLDNTNFIVGVTVFLHLLALWFLSKKKDKKADKK